MICYTSTVTEADCDLYGHMNTLKYMQKFYEAADQFLYRLGASDPILAAKGIGCAYLEFNTKFVKEVFAGTSIEVDISLQEKTAKVITMSLKMYQSTDQILLSEAAIKFLFFSLDTRKSIRLDAPVLKEFDFFNKITD